MEKSWALVKALQFCKKLLLSHSLNTKISSNELIFELGSAYDSYRSRTILKILKSWAFPKSFPIFALLTWVLLMINEVSKDTKVFRHSPSPTATLKPHTSEEAHQQRNFWQLFYVIVRFWKNDITFNNQMIQSFLVIWLIFRHIWNRICNIREYQ